MSSERDWLRLVALTYLSEPLESLSTQLCLCVAVMAKYDGGRQWSSLLSTLVSGMSSADRVCCLRYTFAFYCVVKQLQTVKTPQGRQTFAAVAATVVPHIAKQSRQHTERLCELVSPHSDKANSTGGYTLLPLWACESTASSLASSFTCRSPRAVCGACVTAWWVVHSAVALGRLHHRRSVGRLCVLSSPPVRSLSCRSRKLTRLCCALCCLTC